MRILSFLETSLIDWDGRLTSVIFLGGCNFRCPFCQNYELVYEDPGLEEIPFSRIEESLRKRKGWIDGVVITGGEPLIHRELPLLIERIKGMGMRVKLDTNGSFPDRLRELIDREMIDYVAMDIKAPLDERYFEAIGKRIDLNLLRESISLLLRDRVDYEFRTTLVPGLIDREGLREIARSLKGAKRYVLQQFVPDNAYKEEYRKRKAYGYQEASGFLSSISSLLPQTQLRNFGS